MSLFKYLMYMSNNNKVMRPPYLEKTLQIQQIGLLAIHLERHKLTQKKSFDYHVLHLPDFVVIIPKIQNKFVLIRQYRPAWRTTVIEFPAGVADHVDDGPAITALRELKEETGYVAKEMNKICSFRHSSRSVRFCHGFVAEDLSLSTTQHDEGELILEVIHLSELEINEAITKGEIVDISHICVWREYNLINSA